MENKKGCGKLGVLLAGVALAGICMFCVWQCPTRTRSSAPNAARYPSWYHATRVERFPVPAVGSDTLTITRGIIAGFLLDDGYIKTDAEINSGNSGGPAFNLAYEQIGIASAAKIRDTSATVPGKLGLIRPINLARPLIELAKHEAGE